MASSTGYDTGVRQSLLSKGITNADIGYNSNNGYVTVKGQDFLKPAKVLNGASYDTAQNFNNAWNAYNRATPAVGAASSGATASGYTPKATGAPAAPAGSVGIRNSLQASGYSPSSIGYNNGAVTLNNQPFMQPTYNVGGTAYATPNAYNSALNNYRVGDLTNQVVNNTKLPENQYTQQINDQISYLMNMARNPQTVDPYSTPEYAAYKAAADKQAQESIRAGQESLGSSGFGRSTMLNDFAQGEQNKANLYLDTQMVPQIIAANQAKQQQEYANMMNLLSPLMSQQGYADNRAQTEYGNTTNALKTLMDQQQQGIENRRADAALTGSYLTPEQESNLNALFNLKSQAESPTVTRDQRAALTSNADNIRNALQASGLDISSLGANSNLATAKTSGIGRTLPGQQLDLSAQNQNFNQGLATRQQNFTEGQQNWSNQFDKAKFDEDTRRYGLDYALQQQQIAISQQNADTSQASAQSGITGNTFNNYLDVWKATGKAPSGLEAYGVESGTPWYEGANNIKEGGLTANQVIDNIKSIYQEPITRKEINSMLQPVDVDTGKTRITTDPTQRKKMFDNVVDSGLSSTETMQVLNSLGLTKEEIQKYYDEGMQTPGGQ